MHLVHAVSGVLPKRIAHGGSVGIQQLRLMVGPSSVVRRALIVWSVGRTRNHGRVALLLVVQRVTAAPEITRLTGVQTRLTGIGLALGRSASIGVVTGIVLSLRAAGKTVNKIVKQWEWGNFPAMAVPGITTILYGK